METKLKSRLNEINAHLEVKGFIREVDAVWVLAKLNDTVQEVEYLTEKLREQGVERDWLEEQSGFYLR